MVDAGVEAEGLDRVAALLLAAGDADGAARAALLGDLAGDRADRAAGGGDHDRLALFQLGEVDAEVGGDAGVAEGAEEGWLRAGQRVGQDRERRLEQGIVGEAVAPASRRSR